MDKNVKPTFKAPTVLILAGFIIVIAGIELIREKSEEPKQGPKQMIPQWLDRDAGREHCKWSAV